MSLPATADQAPVVAIESPPPIDDHRWQRTPLRSILGVGMGLLVGWVIFMFRQARDFFRESLDLDPNRLLPLAIFAAVMLGLVGLAFTVRVLGWRRFRYAVTDACVHVRQGAIFRTERSVPFTRIEAVNLDEPFGQRLLGLAIVRIEVAGGTDSNLELSGLRAGDAIALRSRLLAVAHPTQLVTSAKHSTDTGRDERSEPAEVLFSIPSGRVLEYLPLRLTTWLMLVTTLLTIGWAITSAMHQGGLAAIFPALTTIGAGTALVRNVLEQYWRLRSWRVSAHPEGLQVSHGRLSRKTATIRPGRVLGFTLTQGPLLRHKGWWELEAHVAGYAGQSEPAGAVCPLATSAEVRDVLPRLLPNLADGAADLAAQVLAPGLAGPGWLRPHPGSRWFDPVGWRHRGLRWDERYVVLRRGRWLRRVDVADRTRLQLVETVAGPFALRLGFANLRLQLPTGDIVARNLPVAEAERLRDELALTRP